MDDNGCPLRALLGTQAAQGPAELDTARIAESVAERVLALIDRPNTPTWLSAALVMEHCGRGRTTVATAQASGAMHTHRRGERGRPYTKRAVVDAWMQGATPEQQRQVCGCQQFDRSG